MVDKRKVTLFCLQSFGYSLGSTSAHSLSVIVPTLWNGHSEGWGVLKCSGDTIPLFYLLKFFVEFKLHLFYWVGGSELGCNVTWKFIVMYFQLP